VPRSLSLVFFADYAATGSAFASFALWNDVRFRGPDRLGEGILAASGRLDLAGPRRFVRAPEVSFTRLGLVRDFSS
jgi:hypothetical protein